MKVQAAHDGSNLYLRFSWKQPAASGAPKMDEKNPVKIAFMLESGGKVALADESGCWASCHLDSRTTPGAADTKTKYVKEASLADGRYYDLHQWRSGENKGYDGYVADKRVMEGGSALVSAEGSRTAITGRSYPRASSPAVKAMWPLRRQDLQLRLRHS